MKKIEISSVDVVQILEGKGTLSSNGAQQLKAEDGNLRGNHIPGKLRGFDNKKSETIIDKETGEKKVIRVFKKISDIDTNETPHYTSENTYKYALFEEDRSDLPPSPPSKGDLKNLLKENKDELPKKKDMASILANSFSGAVNGWLYTDKGGIQASQSSCLTFGEIKLIKGESNFEQGVLTKASRSKKDEDDETKEASMYSWTSLGDTKWSVPFSIDIKNLRCHQACRALGKETITMSELKDAAKDREDFLKRLNDSLGLNYKPVVDYGEFFHEGSTIKIYPTAGLHINDEGVHILIAAIENSLKTFLIKKSSGYAYNTSYLMDYNNTHRVNRLSKCNGDYSQCNLKKTEDMVFKKYWIKK